MNLLVIVLLAAVVLFAAYVLYGRWLAKSGALTRQPRPRRAEKRRQGLCADERLDRVSAIGSRPLRARALSRARF